jgi:hypothetical protein
MNKYFQWLFEPPSTSEIHNSNSELGNTEWELLINPRTIRRSTPQVPGSTLHSQQVINSPSRTLTYADVRSDRRASVD